MATSCPSSGVMLECVLRLYCLQCHISLLPSPSGVCPHRCHALSSSMQSSAVAIIPVIPPCVQCHSITRRHHWPLPLATVPDSFPHFVLFDDGTKDRVGESLRDGWRKLYRCGSGWQRNWRSRRKSLTEAARTGVRPQRRRELDYRARRHVRRE